MYELKMASSSFTSFLRKGRALVFGMIHVQALPGTPGGRLDVDQIAERALEEAGIYHQHRVDGIVVENMHDRPYLRGGVGPEVVAAMTTICTQVKRAFPSLHFGVQILSGANKEALAVAMATGGSFIRAEGFVFSHVADEGWMDSCAGELLRYRRSIGAEDVAILTDIKKKHCSHAVTADVSLADMSRAAEFFCSDGLVITGVATGDPVRVSELAEVTSSTTLPVVLGSGVTVNNMETFMDANVFIVGSHFKKGGQWWGRVEADRVGRFMERVQKLRRTTEQTMQ